MNKILLFIVIVAGFLRFYIVASVPPALNSDEVAIGYNAYSILKTGRDEYGRVFPFTFRSFDDYKMPVFVYMVAGSMAVFGKSDFAVRFPSALFGTLTVLVTYFLVRELFRKSIINYQLSIISSFLLALSPWHLMFSRTGYEANVSVFFISLGVLLLLFGLKRGFYIVLSAIVFSLAIWTYHTARIFVPLLVFGLTIVYLKDFLNKKLYVALGLIVGIVLLFPIAQLSLSLEGQMRAIGVSSFSNPDDLKMSISRIVFDNKNDLSWYSFFHNRRFEYAQTFLRGYLTHFDLNFLFLDKAIERYRAPGVGLLYLFEFPFLFIGAYQLIRHWSKGSAIIFWWIIAAPIAAAFTLQLPHPVRTLVFLPAIQVVIAMGLYQSMRWIQDAIKSDKKIFVYSFAGIACCLVLLNTTYFFHQFFVHMPIENAKYWYVGRREMVSQLAEIESSYDRIIVSNRLDFPYIFFLYYGKTDPQIYLEKGGTKSGGFLEEGNTLGKYEFRSINASLRSIEEKILFVGLPGEEFKKSLIVKTLNYPDGSPAIIFFQ